MIDPPFGGARSVFRPFETDGVPGSGRHRPLKAEVIALIEYLQDGLAAVSDGVAPVIAKATWADLSAVVGDLDGQRAYVTADAGTHTDPVVGGTVDNEGLYAWSAAEEAWERIGDLVSLELATSGETVSGLSTTKASAPAGVKAALDARVGPVEAGIDDLDVRVATIEPELAAPGGLPILRNLFDQARATDDLYILSTGATAANTPYFVSTHIRVIPGESYVWRNNVGQLCWYDIAGDKLTYIGAVTAGTAAVAPAGAHTLRFSQATSGGNTKAKQELYASATLPALRQGFGQIDSKSAKRMAQQAAAKLWQSLAPKMPINLFDKLMATDGYALGSTGTPSANAAYAVSDFLPLPESGQFILQHGSGGTNGLSYYDEDGNWLSAATVSGNSATTPVDNARFIRMQMTLAQKETNQFSWGTALPSPYQSFGYPTSAAVDLTAVIRGRAAAASDRAEDANMHNPGGILRNNALTQSTGNSFSQTGWGVTDYIEVNPGDFLSLSGNTNVQCWYDHNRTYLGNVPACSFTASIAGNVMTVSAVSSGSLQIGSRFAGSGVTTVPILRQISGTTGGVGVYLVGGSQTVASTAMTATVGQILNNTWIEVPTGAYFYRHQATPAAALETLTAKIGKASRVKAVGFTASYSGTTMTVSAVASGSLAIGQQVIGPGLTPSLITALGTGVGKTGTYTLGAAQSTLSDVGCYAGVDPSVAAKVFGAAGAGGQPWSGKKAYLQGDSQIANGYFQGTLGALTGLAITSQGTPGRSMSGAATAIAAVDLAAFDLIINDHLTNDFSGNVALGTIADSAATASVYGYMLKWLDDVLTRYPGKRVVYFGPTPRTDVTTNGLGLTLKAYNDAMRAFCAAWAIPFCDLLTTAGINSYTVATLTSDTLHYNAAGGVVVGRIKAGFINGVA